MGSTAWPGDISGRFFFRATIGKLERHRSPSLAQSISNMLRRGLERRACLKWARDLVIAARRHPAKGTGARLWLPQNNLLEAEYCTIFHPTLTPAVENSG